MIPTPCKMVVDAKWNVHHGKVVKVISPCYLKIDGQEQYNCICADGSGGGILPENILKTYKMNNMPTPEVTGSAASHSEEIKKLSEAYAEYMCPVEDYCGGVYDDVRNCELPIYKDDAKSVLEWLSKDYVIVPKSKARELRQLVADNADSIDHGLIDGLSDWVEFNLGTALFNEEKE